MTNEKLEDKEPIQLEFDFEHDVNESPTKESDNAIKGTDDGHNVQIVEENC